MIIRKEYLRQVTAFLRRHHRLHHGEYQRFPVGRGVQAPKALDGNGILGCPLAFHLSHHISFRIILAALHEVREKREYPLDGFE